MNRVKELEDLIKHNKVLYYQGRPELSDVEYDKLEEELKLLDADNSVLSFVGTLLKNDGKVKHSSKMLSLGKTYKEDDLIDWMGEHETISMFKVDGISCSLIYEDGKLNLAKTRGDGTFGENILSKVKWLDSIPKTLTPKSNSKVEIRGELYCTEENFFKLSTEMISLGLDKPTSQRNIVAGLISRKDRLELCRYIEFKAFDVIMDEDKHLKTEMDKYHELEKYKFDTLEVSLHTKANDIFDTLDEAKLFMSEGNYQIDGLVFAYNDLALHKELGETAHHPRYKMAFKFPGESKKTTILDISWQVSRNGILTPVANIKPIELSGAKISRVTLHNYGLVKQYNLKADDEIEIIRSGEVIPKFLSVINESNNDFLIPTVCPSCKKIVVIEDIRIVCKNDKCPAIVKESILNFVQKIGMDDLSSKRLEEMIRVDLVKTIDDLYKLKKSELLTLDKVKEKLANKFLETIEKSKNADLITFLAALGISGGAYNKCEKVVRAGFNSIEKLKLITSEKLEEVDSFAEKSSTDFVKSLNDKMPLIDKLLTLGFSFEEVVKIESKISDKRICITGSLTEKRTVIEVKIRDAGGITVASVSKNTDMLLTNDTEGKSSKYKKAIQLEIEIITEQQLLALLE